MADSTISQLPTAVSVSGVDYIPVDQGGVTKKATLAQLGNGAVFLAPGKTLTVNASLTFNGTDATTFTFPSTSATLARTDAPQSFTGLQTFTDGITTPAQITSTIATGTAPFVVASTTPVANLSIGGNAATATILQTARTIDGVSFDGSANILVVAPATHAAPDKTTPVDTDEFSIWDSVSGLLNHVTWANIKATAKAYFDPIYAAIAGSASQVFSVAAATAVAHAVRADQIQGASVTAFTTGGTGTAFTLTPTPAITAYTTNQSFNVIFNVACGAAPTLTISGVGTPPHLVRQLQDGSYQNLIANDFPAGWQSNIKLVSATQALVLKLPLRTFSGNFTRDLTAASGNVAYTGVGFKPRLIRFYTAVGGTTVSSHGEAAQTGGVVQYTADAVAGYSTNASACIFAYTAVTGSNYQYAAVATFDVDGFTLTWTKNASPTGTLSVVYVAEE